MSALAPYVKDLFHTSGSDPSILESNTVDTGDIDRHSPLTLKILLRTRYQNVFLSQDLTIPDNQINSIKVGHSIVQTTFISENVNS